MRKKESTTYHKLLESRKRKVHIPITFVTKIRFFFAVKSGTLKWRDMTKSKYRRRKLHNMINCMRCIVSFQMHSFAIGNGTRGTHILYMHKFVKAETFRGHLQTTMEQPMVAAELTRPQDIFESLTIGPKNLVFIYRCVSSFKKSH